MSDRLAGDASDLRCPDDGGGSGAGDVAWGKDSVAAALFQEPGAEGDSPFKDDLHFVTHAIDTARRSDAQEAETLRALAVRMRRRLRRRTTGSRPSSPHHPDGTSSEFVPSGAGCTRLRCAR